MNRSWERKGGEGREGGRRRREEKEGGWGCWMEGEREGERVGGRKRGKEEGRFVEGERERVCM